jgi:signal transduction histidine kinase
MDSNNEKGSLHRHSMPRTPNVSAAEERAHQEYLDRSCNRAMVAGLIIYALDAVEPWLSFNDPTLAQIQIATAGVIAVVFSLALFGWGKRHKLAIVTCGLLIGTLGFEFIVYKKVAFDTAYAVGFPVLFAYYAVLIPVSTTNAATVGIVLLLLNALPELFYRPDGIPAFFKPGYQIVIQSIVSNFTAFAIILYGRILSNRSWHREFVAQELITDFVLNISHECEGPVAAIGLSSTQLREHRIPAGEIETTFEQIERLSYRVKRQLRALIEFGRLESGSQHFTFAVVDPKEMVEEAVKSFKTDPSTKGVDVDLKIAPNLPYILAHYDSMQMVLWNILDNARKYSPSGETISMKVNASRRLVGQSRFINIAIEDQGIGIPRNEIRGIYNKFVRGEHAKRKNITGTGIGLAIVRQVLAAHKAKMNVKSEVDRGSTFTIVLRTVRK